MAETKTLTPETIDNLTLKVLSDVASKVENTVQSILDQQIRAGSAIFETIKSVVIDVIKGKRVPTLEIDELEKVVLQDGEKAITKSILYHVINNLKTASRFTDPQVTLLTSKLSRKLYSRLSHSLRDVVSSASRITPDHYLYEHIQNRLIEKMQDGEFIYENSDKYANEFLNTVVDELVG